jgi:chromosomal replication initiator protein
MDDSDRLSALRHELRRSLGNERYELWLGPQTSLTLDGEVLLVGCASDMEVQWLRRNLHSTLASCGAAIFGAAPAIEFAPIASADATLSKAKDARPALAQRSARTPRKRFCDSQLTLEGIAPDVQHVAMAASAASAAAVETAAPEAAPRKRQRFTFEDFVVGQSNRMAYEAARSAAQQLGRFSPLLVYGPSGSGKTHLLNAIAVMGRASRQRPRVMQLTAEQFTGQFLEALDKRALPGLRQKTRSLDLLAIDDVHFLGNKRATLEELIYTIDAVQTRGGQVVLSSDRPAAELQSVSVELAARVSAGLAVALDPPDYATRLGILRAMTSRMEIAAGDDVLELVAQQVVGSGRLLSGAINRLVAASMAARKPITMELAGSAIADFCRQHSPQVRLIDIQRAVCEVFGVESTSLKSARKCRSVAEPRMLAMWLARRYTRAALSEIGDFFGRRSHSTVVSAQRKFDGLISQHGEIVVGDQLCQVEEAVRRIEAKLRTA